MKSPKTDFEPLTKLLDDFCTCGESYCVSHRLELGIEKVMEAYLLQESKPLVEACKTALKRTRKIDNFELHSLLEVTLLNFQKKHGEV